PRGLALGAAPNTAAGAEFCLSDGGDLAFDTHLSVHESGRVVATDVATLEVDFGPRAMRQFDRCQFSDRERRRAQPCRQLGFVCPDFGGQAKRHFRDRSSGDTGREFLLGSAGEGQAGTEVSLWTQGTRIREAKPNRPASLAAPIAWT